MIPGLGYLSRNEELLFVAAWVYGLVTSAVMITGPLRGWWHWNEPWTAVFDATGGYILILFSVIWAIRRSHDPRTRRECERDQMVTML